MERKIEINETNKYTRGIWTIHNLNTKLGRDAELEYETENEFESPRLALNTTSLIIIIIIIIS